jgi:hypothetical protein
MSYYAKCKGMATLTKPVQKQTVMDALGFFTGNFDIDFNTDKNGNVTDFWFENYERYDEEKYQELVNKLNVKDATFNFTGEDEELWRLVKKENSPYVFEENGTVIYGSDSKYALISVKGVFILTKFFDSLESAQRALEEEYSKIVATVTNRNRLMFNDNSAFVCADGKTFSWKVEKVEF